MEQVLILVLPVLGIIFGYAIVKGWMDQRAAARAERIKLLEEALKNPAVDRATIESLAYQLTGAKNPNRGSSRFLAILLAFGWIGLFVGIGLWVLGDWTNERDIVAGGIITSIVGFGLVTYPFALRELEARRAQQ